MSPPPQRIDQVFELKGSRFSLSVLQLQSTDLTALSQQLADREAKAENTVLELTYNWNQQEYDVGNGFGHIAIEVDDIYRVTEKMREQGVKFLRDPGPMNAGTTIIAFIADPDGYPIELIGKHA